MVGGDTLSCCSSPPLFRRYARLCCSLELQVWKLRRVLDDSCPGAAHTPELEDSFRSSSSVFDDERILAPLCDFGSQPFDFLHPLLICSNPGCHSMPIGIST